MQRRRFSPAQIREIRARAAGPESLNSIARCFKVSSSMISHIHNRDCYADVEDEGTTEPDGIEAFFAGHGPAPEYLRAGEVIRLKSGGPQMVIQEDDGSGYLDVTYWTGSQIETCRVSSEIVERVRQ